MTGCQLRVVRATLCWLISFVRDRRSIRLTTDTMQLSIQSSVHCSSNRRRRFALVSRSTVDTDRQLRNRAAAAYNTLQAIQLHGAARLEDSGSTTTNRQSLRSVTLEGQIKIECEDIAYASVHGPLGDHVPITLPRGLLISAVCQLL